MDCCNTQNKEECCKKLNSSPFKNQKYLKEGETSSFISSNDQMKGGRKMNLRITLWIVTGALFVVALFLTFQAGAIGSVETTKIATISANSAGAMVGGC